MNIIDRSALYLAKAIRRNNPNAASEAVLNFSLVIVINTISTILLVILFCSITGHLLEGIIAMASFAILRNFSGGIHLKSSIYCTIISAGSLILFAHITLSYFYIGFSMDIVTIILLLLYAPDGFENRSRLNPKYYPLLKVASILVVAANFYIQSSVISFSLLTQALTTTRAANLLNNKFEGRESY